jgi:hypothetical protein
MKSHLVVEIMTEHPHLFLQHVFQFLWGIDIQLSRTPQQSESTDHTNQSETVVAVQMGDEYSRQLGETNA